MNVNDYNRRTDKWHFEKRLSLDTVVSVMGISIVLGGPVLVWGRAMESRVQALELMQEQLAKQTVARELDTRDQRIAMLSQLDKLQEQVTQLRIDLGRVVSLPQQPRK